MDMKRCRDCDAEKPLDDFYKRRDTADRRFAYCKPCHKARTYQQRKVRPDLVRESNRRQRERHPEKVRAATQRWRAANPDAVRDYSSEYYWTHRESVLPKMRARRLRAAPAGPRDPVPTKARDAVKNAVAAGRLTRPAACPRCDRSDVPIQAHHADYLRPLDVEWLCKWCHEGEHHGTGAKQIRPAHAGGASNPG